MRVIEHGDMQYEVVRQCPNCSCKFAFYPREYKFEFNYRYKFKDKEWPDDGEALRYILCPECRAKCYDNGDYVTFTKNQDEEPEQETDEDGNVVV